MKYALVSALALVFSITADSASDPVIHKLELWGKFDEMRKFDFYIGFTNGLVSGAGAPLRSDDTPARQLLSCFLDTTRPSTQQAIAMMDKYYRENPEKWSMPIGQAIIDALLVKGGPCASKPAAVR
jgi:hypothetical protein